MKYKPRYIRRNKIDGILLFSKSSRIREKQTVQVKKYSVNKIFGNFKKEFSNSEQYTKKNIPPIINATTSKFNFFITPKPLYHTKFKTTTQKIQIFI